MTDQTTTRPRHRPLSTRHGMFCICGVFCGPGGGTHGWLAWMRHADDRVILDGSHDGLDPVPISEGMWAVTRAFTKVSDSFTFATRSIGRALAARAAVEGETSEEGGA